MELIDAFSELATCTYAEISPFSSVHVFDIMQKAGSLHCFENVIMACPSWAAIAQQPEI